MSECVTSVFCCLLRLASALSVMSALRSDVEFFRVTFPNWDRARTRSAPLISNLPLVIWLEPFSCDSVATFLRSPPFSVILISFGTEFLFF